MINEENILHEYESWSVEGLLKTRAHIEEAHERVAHQLRYHEAELAVIARLLAEKQALISEEARTGLAKVNHPLRRLYEGAWGPFVAGDYAIGDQMTAPYCTGAVIWSYRQPLHGLTYVVDDSTGGPIEVPALQVRAR